MAVLSRDQLQAYRATTYRLRPELRVTRKEEALAYVNERGFIYFWPIKDVTLPSLWVAVAGERPVADEHDDPGHTTWGWKDELLGARQWHYAKVLRKKATFISLQALPYFYALSENYGEPEKDYLVQYDEGRLTHDAKVLYETMLAEGPLDTISLRKLAHMTSKASDSPFNRAMELLQADFKIVPIGVAEAGAWRYAFVYECVHRHYPKLPEESRAIRQADARVELARLYLRSVGAAQARDVAHLFGWPRREVEGTLQQLAKSGAARLDVQIEGFSGEWITAAELPEICASRPSHRPSDPGTPSRTDSGAASPDP